MQKYVEVIITEPVKGRLQTSDTENKEQKGGATCRPTCVMRHARGQKLRSFRRKWPFCMDQFIEVYSALRTSNIGSFRASLIANIAFAKLANISGTYSVKAI
jgi:hypothetical protein